MKRAIVTLMAALLCALSFNANAQLLTQTEEEAHGFRTVWVAPMKYGEIRYTGDLYILFGATDNRFENKMASIVLGIDKKSAVLSLEDLRKIAQKQTKLKDAVVVRGVGGKETTIYNVMGEIIFKTEGVAGECHLLWAMKNAFNDAEDAVLAFEE